MGMLSLTSPPFLGSYIFEENHKEQGLKNTNTEIKRIGYR